MNNYGYDAIGNLIRDSSENMGTDSIKWNVYGKITSVSRSAASTNSNTRRIEYTYDAAGNRIGKKTTYFSSPHVDYTWYVRDAQGNVLNVYSASKDTSGGTALADFDLLLQESILYGSSRLGLRWQNVYAEPPSAWGAYYDYSRGYKYYELANHLGNVVTVIDDKKLGVLDSSSSLIRYAYYNPELVMANDYYAFGMERLHYDAGIYYYRYGFNGKENDREVKGEGDQVDYGNRVYDPRVGRFLSIDPLQKNYPWYTPYQFSGNNPILFIDLDGLEPATNEQKMNAMKIACEYDSKKNTLSVFSKVNKQLLVQDLDRQINAPEKSTIPVESGWYCGMYAFAYAFTYYDPEGFTKGVLDLVQKGETTSPGGKKISASSSLRDMNINSNVSSFLFSAAVRETYNNFLSASERSLAWSATASGDMIKMLKNVAHLNVKQFSYGHEEVGEGITNEDIGVLKKHTDGGNLALLRVSYGQFSATKEESGQGIRAAFSGGDHWVVLQGIVSYDVDKKTITVIVYDDHQGLQTRTFSLGRFKEMIYHVLMVERAPVNNQSKKKD